MDEDQIVAMKIEIFDALINPLANMMCSFLAAQVFKGSLTKDEAKYVIASSVDVLNMAEVEDHIRDIGSNMLLRMVEAIERLPEPSVNYEK